MMTRRSALAILAAACGLGGAVTFAAQNTAAKTTTVTLTIEGMT